MESSIASINLHALREHINALQLENGPDLEAILNSKMVAEALEQMQMPVLCLACHVSKVSQNYTTFNGEAVESYYCTVSMSTLFRFFYIFLSFLDELCFVFCYNIHKVYVFM